MASVAEQGGGQGGGFLLLSCLGFLGKALAQPICRSFLSGKSQGWNTGWLLITPMCPRAELFLGSPCGATGSQGGGHAETPAMESSQVSHALAFRILVRGMGGPLAPPPSLASHFQLVINSYCSIVQDPDGAHPPLHAHMPASAFLSWTDWTLCLHPLPLLPAPLPHTSQPP